MQYEKVAEMKIRHSLYITIILFTILPIILYGNYMIQVNSDRAEEIMTENLEIVSDVQIAEIQNFCKQRDENLEMLCQLEIVRDLIGGIDNGGTREKEYLDNILRSYVENDECSESLTIVNFNFEPISSSNVLKGDDAYLLKQSREMFKLDGELYFSNIIHTNSNNTEKDIVTAIKGIYWDGKLIGFILEEINLNFFEEIRLGNELWEQGTFYLIDGKDKIITAGTGQGETRKEFVLDKSELGDYSRKWNGIDLDLEPKGCINYMIGKDKYATYYSRIDNTDWRVMVSVNLTSYHKSREQIQVLYRSSLVVFCILLIWISYLVSDRITRPLHGINNTLRLIRQNQDYSLRVEIGRKDELGDLSREINILLSFIEQENLYDKQQKRKLRKLAERDPLTGAYNKQSIQNRLENMLWSAREEKRPFALLFVDVDDFKNFNTIYGHMVGDEVLKFVAAALGTYLDGAVGRVGGDEFIVGTESPEVLHNLKKNVKRMLLHLNNGFVVEGKADCVSIGCSVGGVVTHDGSLDYDSLIQMADEAMFTAKNNGKNCYHIV